MNTSTIKKNTDKRKKEIDFYCIFNDDGKNFQEEMSTVFQEYIKDKYNKE